MGAIGPVHGRIVRMDVTLNVILADTGPSTRENLYSAVARNSARRAEGTLWCTGVECCVQVRRSRWKGHDEAPFLDGRGLRVGPALPMVYPRVGHRGFCGGTGRSPVGLGRRGQYSEGSRRVVA